MNSRQPPTRLNVDQRRQAITGQYFVGLDLGQSQDFTAIAVLQRAELVGEWDPVVYAWKKAIALRLRHLERVPLGTPYTEVVDRVVAVTRSAELAGRRDGLGCWKRS